MDLFVVNRYTSDKEDISKVEEKNKLSKVLKNIDKRKKQREQRKLKSALNKLNQNTEKDIEHNIKIENEVINHENKKNKVESKEAETQEVSIKEAEDNNTDEHTLKESKSDEVEGEGFTILGTDTFNKKQQVKRVLPRWLLNPTVIPVDLQNLSVKISKTIELSSNIRKTLKKKNLKYLFPVQAEVIPWLLKWSNLSKIIIPQDVCVSAPTGSGKTLAFALPVIQTLQNRTFKAIRAVAILPTQGLATQIYKTFKVYCENTDIDVAMMTGDRSFSEEQKQLVSLNSVWGYMSKVDIVVCTAGRLVEHLKSTRGFSLRHLEYLIIDEADRVLDAIQSDWLYHLENHLRGGDDDLGHVNTNVLNLLSLKRRTRPQKLLFSATLSQDPEKLQKLSLFQPKLFTSVVGESSTAQSVDSNHFVGKYTTPSELTEKCIVCSLETKPLVLYNFIRKLDSGQLLVFTNSVDSVHRLKILLTSLSSGTLKVSEISSQQTLQIRNKLMADFASGLVDILVCTDSMARGIDFPNVKCVISYSPPIHIKTYIHRAGRTARAGEPGLAVTLLLPNQKEKFLTILKQANKTNVECLEMSEDDLEPLADLYQKALVDLKQHITNEVQSGMKKIRKQKKSNVKVGKYVRKKQLNNK